MTIMKMGYLVLYIIGGVIGGAFVLIAIFLLLYIGTILLRKHFKQKKVDIF